MSLADFWPTEKNVLECIKPEAENPRDQVFLAIHQPMQLERQHFENDSMSSVTEQDLFKALLTDDVPSGTLLIPIVGCLLYTSPSPRDRQKSRMPSSA